MSLLNRLRDSRESTATAFDRFIRNREKHIIHLFVEGQDDVYFYNHLVNRHLTSPNEATVYPYPCGGKHQVIETHHRIQGWETLNAAISTHEQKLFFVDRDLQDILPKDYESDISADIHVIAWYSIENYLVTAQMLKSVLMTIATPPYELTWIEAITELFEENLQIFHKTMIPLMGWIVYLRQNTKDDFDLDTIRIDELYTIHEDGRVRPRISETDLENAQHPHWAKLASTIGISLPDQFDADFRYTAIVQQHNLDKHNPKRYIRGKFEMRFFKHWISMVERFLLDKISLSGKISVETLSPLVVPIPSDIKVYLDRMLSS